MPRPYPKYDTRHGRLAWVGLVACGLLLLSRGGAAETVSEPCRLGFTISMFTEVNENDARAALKVWANLIARDQNVPADPDPSVFKELEVMRRALQAGRLDAAAVTTLEYDRLRRDISFEPIFVADVAGRTTERYVLLAHRDGPVRTLADLGGRRLLSHNNPMNCLAPLWLDTLLAREGRPAAALFAGKIIQDTRLAQVVLPVFFRKADACLVTRGGFDTMNELNPQLSRQLAVVAESEELVPMVFAVRADYNPSFKARIVSIMDDLGDSPEGRQVLNIFRCDDLEPRPAAAMEPSLRLIEAHEQLTQKGASR